MAKRIISPSQRIGGHIELQASVGSVRRIADAIYEMTHKRRDMQKRVSVFVAGGVTVDKKLEQANKSVVKRRKTNHP